jgi:hypothetical protein
MPARLPKAISLQNPGGQQNPPGKPNASSLWTGNEAPCLAAVAASYQLLSRMYATNTPLPASAGSDHGKEITHSVCKGT